LTFSFPDTADWHAFGKRYAVSAGGVQRPAGDKVLGGISAVADTVWADGFVKTPAARSPLIELHLSS
jgi:hypothetical protein